MLNNEVKDILQEQFSKESNYKKIMYNIEKKQSRNSYIKIMKYALLSTCAIIFVAVIIIPNYNKDDNYKGIAYVNNIKTEENKSNEMIEIADKEIYKTINAGGETSWVYDPTVPENIVKDNITTKYVIKVKVISVGEAEILNKITFIIHLLAIHL